MISDGWWSDRNGRPHQRVMTECSHMHKSVQIAAVVYTVNCPQGRLLVSVHLLLDNVLRHSSPIRTCLYCFLHYGSADNMPGLPGHVYLLISHQSFWAQLHLVLKGPFFIGKVECVNARCNTTQNRDTAWLNGTVHASENMSSLSFWTRTIFNVTSTSKTMICFDKT